MIEKVPKRIEFECRCWLHSGAGSSNYLLFIRNFIYPQIRIEKTRIKNVDADYILKNAPKVKVFYKRGTKIGLSVFMLLVGGFQSHAETITHALAQAYRANPNLNQQRAATRASDEAVSRAVSGYRPQVTATGSFGYNNIDEVDNGFRIRGNSHPATASFTVTQNIFNGNRTANGVRQAESQVLQSREQTRNTELDTLQKGAAAYMNVLRDTAILGLDKNNVVVLEEQLKQTRIRKEAGDVTTTDVAQALSSLETSRSDVFTSQANLQASVAVFRQIIGIEPKHLDPARPIDPLLPPTLSAGIVMALEEHPAIDAARHNADSARLQVQLIEGQLYPTVNVVGNVQENSQYSGVRGNRLFNASALAQLSVPIYTGGDTYAAVRQAKELLSQARLQVDVQRDTVRATLIAAWSQYEAAKSIVRSSQAAVSAAEIALAGVRQEAKVGQRTTLDVLLAQQTLLTSRVNLVKAQGNRVTTSYNVMAALGRLSAANLGLDVVVYDTSVHFEQVKDKWAGLRTPSD